MTKAESRAAAMLGRKGGLSKSESKVQAARDNGKKGGRPKKTLPINPVLNPHTYNP